ncbi:MAG: PQQ-dependent dehydrogenase, methanol/ethanol family [Gammaproteobacteria bacterium]
MTTTRKTALLLALSSAITLAACSDNNEVAGTESPAPSAAPPAAATPTTVTGPDDAALANAQNDASEWLTYGRDYAEQRFSPLNQINTNNVTELGVAWTYDTGEVRGHEASPLVNDGVMYFTLPWSIVVAVDARTGAEKWRFDPRVDKSIGWKACCDVVNRGVALYDGKVYVGTIDGRLIALDANTGNTVWDIVTVDQSRPYTITGAPRIAEGKVLIGQGGSELGTRGYLTAYDAQTGNEAWRFWVVPGNPADGFENADVERAAATWSGEWWEVGGGGTPWDSIIYDPEARLVYVGTGNGSPWSHEIRSNGEGDNLYLSSIVALNVDDGSVAWYYQTVPAENFDYTAVQPLMLVDLPINGVPRKLIMQAPKNGFFYVLDRLTGELISADPYAEVTWASGIDLESGRPIETPQARYTTDISFLMPGPSGAHNWHPMSFNPATGLVYLPTLQGTSFPYAIDPQFRYRAGNWNLGVVNGTMAGIPPKPENEYGEGTGPETRSPGALVAWDPLARQPRWVVDYPFQVNGGTLTTAGNLVFQGGADGFLRAFAADSGQQLWEVDLGVGIMAPPVTYELDGTQYLSVLVGWGGSAGLIGPNDSGAYKGEGRLWTFRIGGDQNIVPVMGEPLPELTEIPFNDDPALLAEGENLYVGNCMLCHGAGGASGGSLPDLRYAAPNTYDSIQAIVRQGAYSSRGMPNLGEFVTEAQVDSIKNWLLSRRAALLAEQNQTQ